MSAVQEVSLTNFAEDRTLPQNIDYYEITEDGSVIPSYHVKADLFIDECDIGYFSDPEMMMYIRESIGSHIGVMRDIAYNVLPDNYRTSKVLLGVSKTCKRE